MSKLFSDLRDTELGYNDLLHLFLRSPTLEWYVFELASKHMLQSIHAVV